MLDEAVLIQVEVEFVPLYRDQPLFADVDQLLRSRGFSFHRFMGFGGRPFKPLLRNGNPNEIISQVLWADAVYVRDVTALDTVTPEKLLVLAVILHEVYRSVDLCHLVLVQHDRATGTDLAPRYLERLLPPA